MNAGAGGTVVVAVGDGTTGHALDWAAAEAAVQRCRLLVVHAEPLPWVVDPCGCVPAADFSSSRVAAENVLQMAVCRARSVATDVEISTALAFGRPVPSLLSRSRGARLLVLGSRSRPIQSRLTDRLPLSVCDRVARRARCPVAMVRPLQTEPHAGASPRVVVGIDGRGSCAAVLGVAFRAAAQRALPLTAVPVWALHGPADHEAMWSSAGASEASVKERLDEALAPFRSRFADVPVATLSPGADPAAVLIRESVGAALLVVGTRGRAARSRLSHVAGRTVARWARCPVVLVPSGKDAADAHAGSGRRAALSGTDPTGIEPVQRPRTPWE